MQRWIQISGRIYSTVVHVITLNPFVHGAESTANNRFALTGKVISKTNAWAQVSPVSRHQTAWDSVLPAYANTVGIELHTGQNRIWTCAQTRARRCATNIRGGSRRS